MDNFETQQVTSSKEPFHYRYPVITLGEWMVTMLLMMIPFVNMILLFVWSFSSETNPNKANWAKSQLIWMGIVIVIYVLILVIAIVAFGGISELMENFS